MDANEMRKEHERLEAVLARVCERLAETNRGLARHKGAVVAARREMGENTAKIIRDFDDVVALASYESHVRQAEGGYAAMARERDLLQKLADVPYFGRVDFAEDGLSMEEIYIGIGSFYDPKTYQVFVYDWRSPIASLFYEHDVGPAKYLCPDGEIAGEVGLKRQYKIAAGRMEYMFDADATINDEILARTLAAAADGRLKVIINSIQREQNAIIRNIDGKNLIVFGPAGSGKTSVGLHRLAYLLYHRRESLSPKNVLVISSNYVFSSYISHILPDLGEDEIPQIIFSDILKEFLPRNFAAGDFYAQAERLLAGGDISQMAAICSAEFLTHMEKFFADFRFAATDVVYEDETIITKAELEQDLNENYAHLPFKSRLSRLFEIVRGRIDDYFAINENAIKSSIRKRNAAAFREAGDDVPADFHSELARAKKEGQRALRRGLGAIGVYKRILRGFHKEIYSERLGHIDEKRLYFEDLLAIACIKIHMGEAAFAGHIRHVLVDEAQDFNILQHYILRHMFPQSRFTLLGDINQGLFPALRPDSAALAAIYGAAQTEEMRLTRSYRSTIPINRLAARFIDDSPDYFARDGEPPLLVIDTDFTNAAADLLKSQIFPNAKTICLLTKTAAKARECYNALKSSLPIKIIENEDADLTAGIWVAPAMLAKGLEFDAVIFSDHEKTADSQTDRLLTYLLCTRALHNLAIIAPPENAQKWRDMII